MAMPQLLSLSQLEAIEVQVRAHELSPKSASAGELARMSRGSIQIQNRPSAPKRSSKILETLDTHSAIP